VRDVHVHVEPLEGPIPLRELPAAEAARIAGTAREALPKATRETVRELRIHRAGPGLVIFLALALPGSASVAEAHALASEVEERLRNGVPDVHEVVVSV
jgi:divalent metal cation (Fe/Co/Zn/Cd) transporter